MSHLLIRLWTFSRYSSSSLLKNARRDGFLRVGNPQTRYGPQFSCLIPSPGSSPRAEGNTLSWYAESFNRFEKTKRNPFSEGIPVLFRAGGGFPNRRLAKRPSHI